MSHRIAPERVTAHHGEVTATVTAGAEARTKLPGSPSSVRANARVDGSAITATVKTGGNLSSAQVTRPLLPAPPPTPQAKPKGRSPRYGPGPSLTSRSTWIRRWT